MDFVSVIVTHAVPPRGSWETRAQRALRAQTGFSPDFFFEMHVLKRTFYVLSGLVLYDCTRLYRVVRTEVEKHERFCNSY